MRPELRVFPGITDLSRAAAEKFVELAEAARGAKGVFSAALSGGRTPETLFRLLCSDEFASRVDWQGVHLFWADERCVFPGSTDSNYGNAYRAMLSKLPLPPGNVHRIKGEMPPELAAFDYEARIKAYFGQTGRIGFDLVLLGAGEDGHTASLFPDSEALGERERLAVPAYVERLKAWRVTITLPLINNSENVVFLVAGRNKAPIMRELLGGGGRKTMYPAGLVSPAGGRLIWLLDEEAAALIGSSQGLASEKSGA